MDTSGTASRVTSHTIFTRPVKSIQIRPMTRVVPPSSFKSFGTVTGPNVIVSIMCSEGISGHAPKIIANV